MNMYIQEKEKTAQHLKKKAPRSGVKMVVGGEEKKKRILPTWIRGELKRTDRGRRQRNWGRWEQ